MKIRTLVLSMPLLVSCRAPAGSHADPFTEIENDSQALLPEGVRWVPVSGTGVHYFTTAIVHSVQPTATGIIQRSTETVELDGDLKGRILYHPVSVFDFSENTLINTGSQAFSGTVLDSQPVMLFDDEFRFEVDLTTGQTLGKVFLVDHLAGPRIRCRLQILGDGQTTPEGDAVVSYSGECRIRQAQLTP